MPPGSEKGLTHAEKRLPPGPSNSTSELFCRQPIPPRATSELIFLIHYFPIQSSRDFGLHRLYWHAEELLCAVAMAQTDATVGHSYLQLSVAPVAQRTAKA